MSRFINLIKNQLAALESLLGDLKKDKYSAKKVTIVAKSNGKQKYFYRQDTKRLVRKRAYLGTKDSPQLKALINSSYKAELIKAVKTDISLLEEMAGRYMPFDTHSVMARLSPCVRNMHPDNDYNRAAKELSKWAAADYPKNSMPFGRRVIRAKDGTRVRSKAECIIYNTLLDAGIPFRYDPLLRFHVTMDEDEGNEVYKSPDFQIKCPDGGYILIEHAGFLSSSAYAKDLAEKIQIYLQNGFALGYNMFVTSDVFDGGIYSDQVQGIVELIKERFIPLCG